MSELLADKTVGFVGAGRMATALCGGVVNSGLLAESQIHFSDRDMRARESFQAALPAAQGIESNAEMAQSIDIVVIAVKPQFVADVAKELASVITSDHLIVSIVAGIQLDWLQSRLRSDRIVRVMPNTPCLVSRGASAFVCGRGVTQLDRAQVVQILSAVGLAIEVTEDQLHAVTGLSGSGPAYVLTVIESLTDGGVLMGLPRNLASQLATQTVLGTAELVKQTGEHPAVLRDQVASPGGTTAHGLRAMEAAGVRDGLIQAVVAATQRSVELSKLV